MLDDPAAAARTHGGSTPSGSWLCTLSCCLGDIVVETRACPFPVVVVWFGWQAIIAERVFAVCVRGHLPALAFGIAAGHSLRLSDPLPGELVAAADRLQRKGVAEASTTGGHLMQSGLRRAGGALLLALAALLIASSRLSDRNAAAREPDAVAPLHARHVDYLHARDLIGAEVFNTKGERLGQVSDLIISCRQSTLVTLVVAVEGAFRFGLRHVAVPRPDIAPLRLPLMLAIDDRRQLYLRPAIATGRTPAPGYRRLTQLFHAQILKPDHSNLGRLEDVLLTRGGTLVSIVVSRGGFMGLGTERETVPAAALACLDTPEELR